MNTRRNNLFFLLFLFLATRILYLLSPAGRIGLHDEAVFGLMAIDIMNLKSFPIYCWEAHYASALVSYIGAVIFKLFGVGFIQIRGGMMLFGALTVVFLILVYEKLFDLKKAFYGTLIFIFCPYVILHYTMGAYGGYGELLLGMALVVYSGMRINEHAGRSGFAKVLFFSGIISGFFIHVLFLIIPAVIAFVFTALYRRYRYVRWRGLAVFSGGFFIGLLPLIIYNVLYPFQTFLRAGGRSLGIGRSSMAEPPVEIITGAIAGKMVYLHVWLLNLPFNLASFVYPFQSPGMLSNVIGVFLLLLLLIFVWVVFRDDGKDDRQFYFRQFALSVLLLVLFHWVVGLNHDRHFMPLLPVWPVIIFYLNDKFFKGRGLALLIIPVFILPNLAGWQSEFRKSFFDPRPVAEFLSSNHIQNFYGSYDTTYPIMFVAGGRLNGAPYLIDDGLVLRDRTRAITAEVRSASRPAFVFAHHEQLLEKTFERFLSGHHIHFLRRDLVNATVFYQLSRKVDAFVRTEWKTDFEITGQPDKK